MQGAGQRVWPKYTAPQPYIRPKRVSTSMILRHGTTRRGAARPTERRSFGGWGATFVSCRWSYRGRLHRPALGETGHGPSALATARLTSPARPPDGYPRRISERAAQETKTIKRKENEHGHWYSLCSHNAADYDRSADSNATSTLQHSCVRVRAQRPKATWHPKRRISIFEKTTKYHQRLFHFRYRTFSQNIRTNTRITRAYRTPIADRGPRTAESG